MQASLMVAVERQWTKFFDATLPAVAEIAAGEAVEIETYCCAMGAVSRSISATPEGFYTELNYTPGMPLTGPIRVPGAKVGDTLAIEVLDIEIADQGWTMAMRGRGVMGHRIETGEGRVVPIRDGYAVFEERVRIPVRPMIGCIGVTPAGEKVRGGLAGVHGGNMDCTLLTRDTTLFLPVLVPGALLALGDLHAVMGDGESGVAGLEIAGRVTLRVRVLRGVELPLPLLETHDRLATIYSDQTLDLAAAGAMERMVDFLAAFAGMSVADAAMLLSLCGDLRICQVVNPVKTCRMEIPKSALADLGVELATFWKRWEVAG